MFFIRIRSRGSLEDLVAHLGERHAQEGDVRARCSAASSGQRRVVEQVAARAHLLDVARVGLARSSRRSGRSRARARCGRALLTRISYQVGSPWMFDGNRFLPETGMPMRKIACMSRPLALAEPVPLTLASLNAKSLTRTARC